MQSSLLHASYTTTERAVFTEARVKLNELVDETDLFQLGQQSVAEFTQVSFGSVPQVSSVNMWPTKETPGVFKFNSYWIILHQEVRTIERQTYSILTWLGDVGGLYDGLRILASSLIAPVAAKMLRQEQLSKIFTILEQPKKPDRYATM